MARPATSAMQAWPARAPLPSLLFILFSFAQIATWKPYWAGPLFKSARPRFSRPFNSSKNFEISVKYDKNQRTSNANNFRSTDPN
jgi:hypothetical protein